MAKSTRTSRSDLRNKAASGALNFKKAKEAAGELKDGAQLDAGAYIMRLSAVKHLKATSKDRSPQIQFTYTVLDPSEFAGRRANKWQDISDEGLPYLLKELERLGCDIDDIDSVEDILEAIEELRSEKPIVRTRVKYQRDEKTQKDYMRLYVNDLLDEDEADDFLEDGDDVETEEGEDEAEKPAKKKGSSSKTGLKSTDDDDDDDTEEDEDEDEDEDTEEDEEDDDDDEDTEEEEEDDDDDAEAVDWQTGDRVVVDFDGEDFAGKVSKLAGDIATVRFDDGTTEAIDVGDLRSEDDTEEDDDDADEDEDVDDEDVEAADDDDDDDEEDEDEDETPVFTKGDAVTVRVGKKKVPGSVSRVMADGKLNVKPDDGTAVMKNVDPAKVEIDD